VGESVPGQQHTLEKQHAGSPHTRASTKPRQNVLGDDQLKLEQQESTYENSEAK